MRTIKTPLCRSRTFGSIATSSVTPFPLLLVPPPTSPDDLTVRTNWIPDGQRNPDFGNHREPRDMTPILPKVLSNVRQHLGHPGLSDDSGIPHGRMVCAFFTGLPALAFVLSRGAAGIPQKMSEMRQSIMVKVAEGLVSRDIITENELLPAMDDDDNVCGFGLFTPVRENRYNLPNT